MQQGGENREVRAPVPPFDKEIVAFLKRKWERELDYRLEKNLWCHQGNRIAVRFEYESRDKDGQWWRSHPYPGLRRASASPPRWARSRRLSWRWCSYYALVPRSWPAGT